MNSLTFRHEFSNVSKLGDNGEDAPIRFHADLPWRLHVRSETSDRTGGEKKLGVFIYCNEEDESGWSCDVTVTLKVVHRNSEAQSSSFQFMRTYKPASTCWGTSERMKWDRLMNPAEGFVHEDKMIIEATINVEEIFGVRKMVKFDFSSPLAFGSDNVVLVVEGKKVHVGKQFLAIHSPVFETMFYKDYAEKGKEEIDIKDVAHDEFIELLNMIYPSCKKLTVNSYRAVLVLADRFAVKIAVDSVEAYLIGTKLIPLLQKLKIADEFRLDLLREQCINSCKTLKEMKALKSHPDFKTISDKTFKLISIRMMDLVE